MPSPNNNLIKYNQGKKSLKLPFVIYAGLKIGLKINLMHIKKYAKIMNIVILRCLVLIII